MTRKLILASLLLCGCSEEAKMNRDETSKIYSSAIPRGISVQKVNTDAGLIECIVLRGTHDNGGIDCNWEAKP